MQPGPKLIEIDGATTNSNPPYPRVILKMNIQTDRDNQFTQPISMQQITSPGVDVGYTGGAAESPDKRLGPGVNPFFVNITDRNVTLDIPTGTQIRFPDGKTLAPRQPDCAGKIAAARPQTAARRLFVNDCADHAHRPRFEPGAILSFPNPDPANLNAGAKIDFYRYDEASDAFVKRGTGTVSQDKSRVGSEGRIVDQASYWFAAAQSGVTTVTGRVIDRLGLPVSGAHVTVKGRADTTDENGGFIITDVATAGLTQLQAVTTVNVSGLTSVGTVALSNIVTRTGPGYAILSALATLNNNALDSYAYVEITRSSSDLRARHNQ
ncbi:MAG TPA: carboxypeptidase-like regulatory domain-containing protein [Blastocatellia bacterium]|nr:carboxypeptidase-like regulatory domain-containing protein [Blastocatellia bacterium]